MILIYGSSRLFTDQLVTLKKNKSIVFDQNFESKDHENDVFTRCKAVVYVLDSITDLVAARWDVNPDASFVSPKREFHYITLRFKSDFLHSVHGFSFFAIHDRRCIQ
jgi:hypothetical protein